MEQEQVGNTAPRPVSRGASIQRGFLGIDSLYLILEYPRRDVFDFWFSIVNDLGNQSLYEGIIFEDFVLRKGAHGYQLSIWYGDARLFVTDRVNETLQGTGQSGQGMGVMLQLGPKWLRAHGDESDLKLIENVLDQFRMFLIVDPENYLCRLNRVDITLDVVGLRVADLNVDEWRNGWVGYAHNRYFYDTGASEGWSGFVVGTSSGSVRFKVYDKVAESRKSLSSGFWRSVWGLDETDAIDVARFEWSIRPYAGKFKGIRYLTDLSIETLMDLLNYASVKWGRLCVAQADDHNKARWELAPLWLEIRQLIDDWTSNYQGQARRAYDFRSDLSESYLNSASGWLAGLMARYGIQTGSERPASLGEILDLLRSHGYSLPQKAQDKWELLSRLVKMSYDD